MVLSNEKVVEMASQNENLIRSRMKELAWLATEWGVDRYYSIADCRNLAMATIYVAGRIDGIRQERAKRSRRVIL